MRRSIIFTSLAGLLTLYVALVILAPIVGLNDEFVQTVLRTMGASRAQQLAFPMGLSVVLLVYVLLGIGVETPKMGWRIFAVLRAAWTDGATAAQELLNAKQPQHPHETWIVAAISISFGAVFAIFLWKFGTDFFTLDQHSHQTFIDYDIDWGTPVFSFGGNVLYHFGIQIPLNTHLLPLEKLAQSLPPEYRIVGTVALCFLAVGGLFFILGGAIGLRCIPRAIFAGAVALLVTTPRGLDRMIWLLPPNFFTSQFVYALWWLEAPILFLATVFQFFWLGQCRTLWSNITIAGGFALGTFAVILSFPAGAIYFVFLTALYCLGFILTCRSRNELAWKAGVSALLIVFMVVLRVPQFLIGLYSYTFGAYFWDLLRQPTATLVHSSFMVTLRTGGFAVFSACLVFLSSMGALAIAAFMSSRAIGRIAIAALVCEGGIALAGVVNMLIFRAPMPVAYAEIAHSPIWGAYFILFCIIVAVVLDRRLADLPRHTSGKILQVLAPVTSNRRAIYLAGLFVMISAFAGLQPRSAEVGRHWYPHPPTKPASLELVAHEVAIAPGQSFRGRLLTLVESFEEWKHYLDNDHFIEAASLHIPMMNEYQHWTSPVSFVFLRTFFGKTDDTFEKMFFPLHAFHLRTARLMGVRMVATDAADIPGGTLIYETKAGNADLRIFRLDDINLGQYSPTSLRRVRTAAEALTQLRASDFDPKHNVVVEDAIPSLLVPASSAKVKLDLGPSLVVQASSPSRSLLVLPFEYSHCLHLDAANNGRARLIPVNLQQTGLLFEGNVEARISYRFGLLADSSCRGDDLERAKALKLHDVLPAISLTH